MYKKTTKKQDVNKRYILAPHLENVQKAILYNAGVREKKLPVLDNELKSILYKIPIQTEISIRQSVLELMRTSKYLEDLLLSSKNTSFSLEGMAISIVLLNNIVKHINMARMSKNWPNILVGHTSEK